MFQALRQIGYGGKSRLQGEVFARLDLRNDDRLLELKYVKDVPEKGNYEHCDQCSRDFVNAHFYEVHFLEVHGPAALREAPAAKPQKLEDEFPGGLVKDMRSGAVRAGRA
jgi:hypothetical protein